MTGIKRKITCLILRVLILAPTLFSSLFTLTCVAGGMLWFFFGDVASRGLRASQENEYPDYNNAASYAGYFQVHKNLLFNIGRR